MESGVISQQNSVYVLNSSYNVSCYAYKEFHLRRRNVSYNMYIIPQSADMLSLFVAPTVKYEHNKCVQSMMSTLQTKIPQKTEKDTFNEKTRKSLLKINLFIKRLKWFNIFTDSPASRTTTSSKAQGTNCAQISKETNPKWFVDIFPFHFPYFISFFVQQKVHQLQKNVINERDVSGGCKTARYRLFPELILSML